VPIFPEKVAGLVPLSRVKRVVVLLVFPYDEGSEVL
jgi:hypothetical protein